MGSADKRAQIVVAGHICLDVIPQLAGPIEFVPGKLTHIGPASTATGGAVANVGLALHRLGMPVSLVGRVGGDAFGREVLRILSSHDLALAQNMSIAPNSTTSYSIVLSPPGADRSFLHCPGTNDEFDSTDLALCRLEGARLVHFGYPPIMRRTYADGGTELARTFREIRSRGIATSLDLCGIDPASDAGRVDWRAWLAMVLPTVDFFLPSLDETLIALQLSPEEMPSVATLRRVAEALIAMGVAVVVLKLGVRGLYCRTTGDHERLSGVGGGLLNDLDRWRNRELISSCFEVDVVGTTGSGDCTIAGFLASLLRGMEPDQALLMANAVGACSVEAADGVGGIQPWIETKRRVRAGWRQRPSCFSSADLLEACP